MQAFIRCPEFIFQFKYILAIPMMEGSYLHNYNFVKAGRRKIDEMVKVSSIQDKKRRNI